MQKISELQVQIVNKRGIFVQNNFYMEELSGLKEVGKMYLLTSGVGTRVLCKRLTRVGGIMGCSYSTLLRSYKQSVLEGISFVYYGKTGWKVEVLRVIK